jgi:hypothetical protein
MQQIVVVVVLPQVGGHQGDAAPVQGKNIDPHGRHSQVDKADTSLLKLLYWLLDAGSPVQHRQH